MKPEWAAVHEGDALTVELLTGMLVLVVELVVELVVLVVDLVVDVVLTVVGVGFLLGRTSASGFRTSKAEQRAR